MENKEGLLPMPGNPEEEVYIEKKELDLIIDEAIRDTDKATQLKDLAVRRFYEPVNISPHPEEYPEMFDNTPNLVNLMYILNNQKDVRPEDREAIVKVLKEKYTEDLVLTAIERTEESSS